MDERTKVVEYIKRACKTTGLTYSELARAAGISPSTITRFMSGADHKYLLSTRTLSKIARATGLPEFSPEDGHKDIVIKTAVGVVQAGVLQKVLEDFDMDKPHSFPSPRYPFKPEEYSCLVSRGDSMNLVWPEETPLLCVDIFRYSEEYELETGDFVIVQRKQNGDFETTVKELEIKNGEYWLWPRSKSPKFQQPLHWEKDKEFIGHEVGINDGEVRITAVVMGWLATKKPHHR